MRTLIAMGLWLAVFMSGAADVFGDGDGAVPPEAPAEWPLADHAYRAGGHTVVVVLDASAPSHDALNDLVAIHAAAGGAIDTHLVVELPARAEPDWTDDALWSRIRGFDDAVVHLDAGGLVADSFGAMNGGTTLVFGPRGELVRDAASLRGIGAAISTNAGSVSAR